MGRPTASAGIDRVAAFIRDNKRYGVTFANNNAKGVLYKLDNEQSYRLTHADIRRLEEQNYEPRWRT